eukprot:CAMPEP_0184863348 /NCGR_PEP_ID=MMETSP0580-20130426/10565_1 /TAXON_ID=1118495 /ORGANISM="Dactyliosolen fragilissimus" /LENGTH=68 /DNA_ID=CAMNT_0027361627 /DNA_START=116 /DNA_END=322 /DNA_ORIENTATION=+
MTSVDLSHDSFRRLSAEDNDMFIKPGSLAKNQSEANNSAPSSPQRTAKSSVSDEVLKPIVMPKRITPI